MRIVLYRSRTTPKDSYCRSSARASIGRRRCQCIDPGEAWCSNNLPCLFQQLLGQLGEHLKALDQLVKEMDRQIQQWHGNNETSQRLAAIAGVGSITASAMIASVGDARNFRNGRQLAAWL